MLINHLLSNTAQKFHDKNAIHHNNEWMTYGKLEQESNKLANYIKNTGAKRGDKVAILLDNSFNYVISYYAILKADCVVVSLNTENTSETLLKLLISSEAKICIAGQKYFRFLLPIINKAEKLINLITDKPVPEKFLNLLPCEQVLLSKISDEGIDSSLIQKNIDLDLSAIIFTSGSTGEPKGVMLSHLNTVSNTHSIIDYLSLTANDRILDILPFYYVYGKTLLNTHVATGGSVVIDNRFTYPNVVLDTLHNLECSGFAGVPSTFMILLNKTNVLERDFPHLRYLTQAGGHLAPHIQKQLVDGFPKSEVFIMYGSTELSPRQTYVPPKMLPEKLGSIGISLKNTETFIGDENGNPLPIGQEGEIFGRGTNVMMGYWKDPKGTNEVLINNCYKTGDLGKMDEDGYIFITGRSKDMLKIGGNRASAKEIEDAILSIECIHEAAVVGIQDDILGEAPKAFLTLNEGFNFSEVDIKKELNLKLAQFKIPKYFELVENLPKNSSGKILKTKLK